MLKKLERMLPHAVILICNMYIVFFLIDRVNQAMNFIDNGLTKGLLAIMCAIALYDAWRLLKPAPAPMPRRRPAPRDSYDTVAAPREREGRYASRSRLYEDGYRGSGNYGAGGTPRNDHRTDRYGGSRHEVHYRSTDVRSGDYRSYRRTGLEGYRYDDRHDTSNTRRSGASRATRDRFDDLRGGYGDRRVYGREGERR